MTRMICLALAAVAALAAATPAMAERGQNAFPPQVEVLDPEEMEAMYEARTAYAGGYAAIVEVCKTGGRKGHYTRYLTATFTNYVNNTGIDMDEVRAAGQELQEAVAGDKKKAAALCEGTTWSLGRIEGGKMVPGRIGARAHLTAADMDMLALRWVPFKNKVLAGERVDPSQQFIGPLASR